MLKEERRNLMSNEIITQEQPHIFFELYVAGLNFHQYKEVKDQLVVGYHLDMVREPENEYDQNAVRLYYDGNMLGFVPSRTGEAQVVSRALEEGVPLEALIIKHDPEAKVHRRVKFSIKVVEVPFS